MANTDVVIVGAGPTGLMLACLLQRANIRFRIIDKQSDRAHESRALVIHARSMELFQNLGLADRFLSVARRSVGLRLFVHGKLQVEANFQDIADPTTPFPFVYFLSQAETERILIEHLEKQGVHIERNMELSSFHQNKNSVQGQFIQTLERTTEEFSCRFLVGCDGSHSKVRHILDLPFEGAPYLQDFILADVELKWPYDSDHLSIFLSDQGVLAQFPLKENVQRLIITETNRNPSASEDITLEEVDQVARQYVRVPFELSNPVWLSRFHLHHRIVPTYQKECVFLAGDAAHIHSPAGGQGMNTGLQDAANLAWKLALVIKGIAPLSLLQTYTQERLPVGRTLLKTTDRFFSVATNPKKWVAHLRNLILPTAAKIVFSQAGIRRWAFHFVSQLGIQYSPNPYLWETRRLRVHESMPSLKVGARAPDAPTNQGNLFEIFKGSSAHVLVFRDEQQHLSLLRHLKEEYRGFVQFHEFQKTAPNMLLYERYHVDGSAIYFVRPDGYIGFHSQGEDFPALIGYLEHLYSDLPSHAHALPRETTSYLEF
jgi:2-polyprenyl-6-methoxyphenol hydroxylase-like FAD-dependent oxidoreductase